MANPQAGADCAAVVLSQGTRPDALAEALRSILDQGDVQIDTVVMWNGTPAGSVDPRVRSCVINDNVGIPAGRNAGVDETDAPFILFLDDDARLLGHDIVARAVDVLQASPDLAVLALHIVDPDGDTGRRHVPRLGGRSAERSGPVAAFLGGACVVRRSAWDAVGRYEDAFFYAMEETDVSWRLVDQGWSIWYAADLTVEHPRVEPSRHGGAVERTARNRAWAARRNLPAILVPIHLTVWAGIGIVRALSDRRLPRGLLAGYRSGFGPLPGGRSPMRWSTVWRLIRLGRPPVI